MRYAIQWTLKPKSYYVRMCDIGPMFGGTTDTAATFDTREHAAEVVNSFPLAAIVGSEVVEFDDGVTT